MALTWPLMGGFNIAYGEMSVLFGVIFLGAALAMAKGWDLLSVAIYAAFAGLASIELGLRLYTIMPANNHPQIVMLGFVLSGLAGVFAAPTLHWFRKVRVIRVLGALAVLGAACVWAMIGYMSYWLHMDVFKNYQPEMMRTPPAISAPAPPSSPRVTEPSTTPPK